MSSRDILEKTRNIKISIVSFGGAREISLFDTHAQTHPPIPTHTHARTDATWGFESSKNFANCIHFFFFHHQQPAIPIEHYG